MVKWSLLALAVALLPSTGNAGPFSYVCQIEGFQAPPGQDTEGSRYFGEMAMGTPLNIDRDTGRVIHPVIGNESYHTADVTLINRGSEGWSFKAIAGAEFSGHIRYYEVHEYEDGPDKPFLAVADGVAYWGTCR
jgi:hypothetical protein